MDDLAEVLTLMRKDAEPVVVYGAGTLLSRATVAALRKHGVNPIAFADGRVEMDGTELAGLPVMSADSLAERHPSAHVFICLTREYGTVRDILSTKGMRNLHDVVQLLSDFPEHGGEDDGLEHLVTSHAGAVMSHGGGLAPPLVNLIVTEYCSLNCRDCCNLMPYVQDRKHFHPDELLRAAWALAEAVDILPRLRLIGGEPFVYPSLAQVIDGLAPMEKARNISLATNGTVMPSSETVRSMKAAGKVHVLINHYGVGPDCSRELCALLGDEGIAYTLDSANRWSDMGGREKRNRSASRLSEVYAKCTTKACAVVLAGKVYNCARSAFGTRVGWLDTPSDEEVDLFDCPGGVAEKRRRIRRLLFEKPFLSACDYCEGTRVDSPTIEPARQMARG